MKTLLRAALIAAALLSLVLFGECTNRPTPTATSTPSPIIPKPSLEAQLKSLGIAKSSLDEPTVQVTTDTEEPIGVMEPKRKFENVPLAPVAKMPASLRRQAFDKVLELGAAGLEYPYGGLFKMEINQGNGTAGAIWVVSANGKASAATSKWITADDMTRTALDRFDAANGWVYTFTRGKDLNEVTTRVLDSCHGQAFTDDGRKIFYSYAFFRKVADDHGGGYEIHCKPSGKP